MQLQCMKLARNNIRSLKELSKLSSLRNLVELTLKENPGYDKTPHAIELCLFYIKQLQILDGQQVNELLQLYKQDNQEIYIDKSYDQLSHNSIYSQSFVSSKEIQTDQSYPSESPAQTKEQRLNHLSNQIFLIDEEKEKLKREIESIREAIRRKEEHLVVLHKQLTQRSLESYLSDADGFLMKEEKASANELLELEKLIKFKQKKLESVKYEEQNIKEQILKLENNIVYSDKIRKKNHSEVERVEDRPKESDEKARQKMYYITVQETKEESQPVGSIVRYESLHESPKIRLSQSEFYESEIRQIEDKSSSESHIESIQFPSKDIQRFKHYTRNSYSHHVEDNKQEVHQLEDKDICISICKTKEISQQTEDKALKNKVQQTLQAQLCDKMQQTEVEIQCKYQQTEMIQVKNAKQQTEGVVQDTYQQTFCENKDVSQQTEVMNKVAWQQTEYLGIHVGEQTDHIEVLNVLQQTEECGVEEEGQQTDDKEVKEECTQTDMSFSMELLQSIEVEVNKFCIIPNTNPIQRMLECVVEMNRLINELKIRNKELKEQLESWKLKLLVCEEAKKLLQINQAQLRTKYKDIQLEFNEYKATQETNIQSLNEKIERLKAENGKQNELKEKINEYKNDIKELQNQIQGFNLSLNENIERSAILSKEVAETAMREANTLKQKINEYELENQHLRNTILNNETTHQTLSKKYIELKDKGPDTKTVEKLFELNAYFEATLSKTQDNAMNNTTYINIIDNSLKEENFNWQFFITNITQYIKKTKAYKSKLNEVKNTKESFIRYVESQVAELNKSWSLVKEQEQENQELIQQVAKKEDDRLQEIGLLQVRKQELEEVIMRLSEERDVVKLKVSRVKEEYREINKQKANADTELKNTLLLLNSKADEMERMQKRIDSIEERRECLLKDSSELKAKIEKAKTSIEDSKQELNKLIKDRETVIKEISKLQITEKELKQRVIIIETEFKESEKKLKEQEHKGMIYEEQRRLKLEYLDKLLEEKNGLITKKNKQIIQSENDSKKANTEYIFSNRTIKDSLNEFIE